MFSESDADINRQAGALRTSFITVEVRASTSVCWLTIFFMFHMFFKLAMLLGLAATLPVLDKPIPRVVHVAITQSLGFPSPPAH